MDATVPAPGLDLDRFLEACRGQQIIPRIDDVSEMALRAQILLLRNKRAALHSKLL